MRFKEAYEGWNAGRLTQAEAAQILGMCERSFRRHLSRFEADGLEGLIDRRLGTASNRQAPVDEVMALTDTYQRRHLGWNVKHFHSWYRSSGGARSYSWVKKRLQDAELVPRAKKRGAHRKRRERSALPGMMIHQDGSTHAWVAGQMWDLIVTLDDATSEHYSMFFVDEEGTASSFRGVREIIEARGLFSSFVSDRGSHYWHTPDAGGKVDKANPTQFGRAATAVGHRDDCGLFAPSTRQIGARLWHASGALAAGIGAGRHHRHGSRQSLLVGRLSAGLQRRIHPAGTFGRLSFRAVDWWPFG